MSSREREQRTIETYEQSRQLIFTEEKRSETEKT